MLPREQGGVVDANLRVYGLANVRVADASVVPIALSTHLMSSTYGVAEQAGSIIRDYYLNISTSTSTSTTTGASTTTALSAQASTTTTIRTTSNGSRSVSLSSVWSSFATVATLVVFNALL